MIAFLEAEDTASSLNVNIEKEKDSMKIKTNVKAGGIDLNHNQTITRRLKVKTNVKAGSKPDEPLWKNHNQTIACGIKVKTNVKAGRIDPYKNF